MTELSDSVAKGAIEVAVELGKDFLKGVVSLGRKEVEKSAVDLSLGFGKFLAV